MPEDIQGLADKNFKLLKRDSFHPSLHFKKVGIEYRAVAVQREQEVVWFWIGHHDVYKRLISRG